MKKRLAIISEHASPLAPLGHVDSGGQNVYVGYIARHLAMMGNAVDVFTRRDDPSSPFIQEWENGVRVINITAGPVHFVRKERLAPHMREFATNMTAFIESNNLAYDVVHANFWMSGMVAAYLKVKLGLPFAITFHALGKIRRQHQKEADEFPSYREDVETKVAAAADIVIAECPQDEHDLHHLYHVPWRKMAMVSCGFDPAEFEPLNKEFARVLLGFSPHEKIVLQLGRMVPRKGVDTVIRAVARLIHKGIVAPKLMIVGGETEGASADAVEIRRLRSIAQAEHIADHVLFRGRVERDQLKYYYSAADMFVTVPWYEPFGITPLEAMACETPVIGADVGGIKYSVVDGVNGFLVPPKNSLVLADRIETLYRHPGLMELFGRSGLDRVRNNFTWQIVAASIDRALTGVITKREPMTVS